MRRKIDTGVATLGRPGVLGWVVAALLICAAKLLPDFSGVMLIQGVFGVSALLVLSTARAWAPRHPLAENFMILGVLLVTAVLLMRTADVVRVGLAPMMLLLAILATSAWVTRRFAPDLGQTGALWLLCAVAPQGVWAGVGMAVVMLGVAANHFDYGVLAPFVYVIGAFVGRLVGAGVDLARGPQLEPGRVRRQPQFSDPADGWKHGHD